MLNLIMVDDECSIEIITKFRFRQEIEAKIINFLFFSSPESCLEYLKNNFNSEQSNLLISDVNMPNMDGFEFCTIVKQKYKNIPFYFMSAYDFPEYKNRALTMGAIDYFAKPIDVKKIRTEVLKYLVD